jgi:hypothetical protein
MGYSSRRLVRTVAIVAAIAAPCAGFAACGLDESGLAGDASVFDVMTSDVVAVDSPPDVIFDNYVPPTCANLDASCLGPSIPAGWIPIGLANDAASPCPGDSEDFDQRDWVTNPKLHPGACACGQCTTTGAWTCEGQVSVGTGNNGCNGSTDTFDAAPHCTTTVTSGGNSQVAGSLPSVGGNVACDASVSGNGQVDTTRVRTCKPLQCTTDYCGLVTQGFSLCILYNGDAGCPSGFNPAPTTNNTGQIDVPQNAASTCNACACTVKSPGTTCTAELRTFATNDCDGDGGTGGAGFMDAYAAQGINNCLPINSSNLTSVFYVPGSPPDAGCTTTTPAGGGSAALKAPVTVCCKP